MAWASQSIIILPSITGIYFRINQPLFALPSRSAHSSFGRVTNEGDFAYTFSRCQNRALGLIAIPQKGLSNFSHPSQPFNIIRSHAGRFGGPLTGPHRKSLNNSATTTKSVSPAKPSDAEAERRHFTPQWGRHSGQFVPRSLWRQNSRAGN